MRSKPSDGSRPWVVAHRGASAYEMENTLPAFAAALRMQADAIELDIQLTRDGVPVVYHDRTVGKLNGRRRRVGDYTLEELRRWDFSRRRGPSYVSIGVPSLDEVLDGFGGKIPLMLEIKADGERPRSKRWQRLVDAVIEAVKGRALASRVYVLSFDAAVLAAVRSRAPELACVRNVGELFRWDSTRLRALDGMHALCLPARFATARLGHRLHERGLQLWVYRCDTERALARALGSHADACITDDPAWLHRRLPR